MTDTVQPSERMYIEPTDQIAAALAAAQAEFEPIKFDARVTVRPKDPSKGSYTFEYATFANILASTRKALSKNGLALSQTFENTILTTRLLHSSGQQLKSTIDLPIDPKMSNQDIGGVMTYFKRYAFSALIGISAEADDDANGADGNQYEKTAKTPTVATAKPSRTKPIPKTEPQQKQEAKPTEPVTQNTLPYGAPTGEPISPGTVNNIIKAFGEEGISQAELEDYAGYPISEWTLNMKSMALEDYKGLKQKVWTKDQVLSGSLLKK